MARSKSVGRLAALVAVVAMGSTAFAQELAIRVLDAVTRTPVAGARVHVVSESRLPGRYFPRKRVADPERHAEQYGLEASTDDDGTVRVPAPSGAFAVSARRDSRWAYRRLRGAPSEPLELLIGDDRTLRIRVVDRSGAPCAGVPVALKDYDDSIRTRLWEGVTGDGGVVDVSHVQWRCGRVDAFAVTFHFATAEPIERRVVLADLPVEPVELVLPETTAVRVRVTGEGVEDGLVVAAGRGGDSSADPRPTRETRDGVVVFPYHGVGAPLFVTIAPKNRRYPWISNHRGPDAPGPDGERVVSLRMRPSMPVAVGRAVTRRGSPIADALLSACQSESGSSRMERIRTDVDGRFSLVLETGVAPSPERSLELSVQNAPGCPGTSRIELDLSGPLRSGDVDLGDVVFRSPEPILSGQVVDDTGAPIAGAEITVWRRVTIDPRDRRDDEWLRAVLRHPIASDARPEEPRAWRWTTVNDLEWLATDAKGRFSLSAICPPGPLRISVTKRGYCSEIARPVRRGGSGERFMMPRAARVTGTILVDSAVGQRELSIEAIGAPAASGGRFASPSEWESHEPPARDRAVQQGALDHDAATVRDGVCEIPFAIDSLGPGVCRIVGRLRGQPEPLFEIPGVVVAAAGAEVRPPALQRLDLTAQLRTVGFFVRDAHGQLPVGAEVRVFRGLDRRQADYIDVANALVWANRRDPNALRGALPLTIDRRSRLDVAVVAPGYRTQYFDDVRQDVHVCLTEGIPLRIDLPAIENPSRHHFGVFVDRVRDGPTRTFTFPSDSQRLFGGMDLPAQVSGRAAEPGRHRVTVIRGVTVVARGMIDILGAGEQTFSVPRIAE